MKKNGTILKRLMIAVSMGYTVFYIAGAAYLISYNGDWLDKDILKSFLLIFYGLTLLLVFLPAFIISIRSERSDNEDRKNDSINHMAFLDSLTSLPNRRKFIDQLTDKLNEGKKGAVMLLDLDGFKEVNDTLGHAFGDRVIEAFAEKLSGVANDRVMVSRFGGDEFMILAERGDDPEELNRLVRRLAKDLGSPTLVDSSEIKIDFSMGITLFPEDGTDISQLIMNADLAMYSVKDSGGKNYKYFNSGMMQSRIRKSRIEALLLEAIETDGFTVVYQPQIDLKTSEVYGYEALARIKEEDISPAEFIPMAEINGSIVKIGRIITEKTIRQLARWKESGLEPKPVSINFSIKQIHDGDYLRFLGNLLKKHGIPPQLIEMEISCNIFLKNSQAAKTFLKRLKDMGISVSIDDFGAGFSSLNSMPLQHIDKIKLDRTLNMKYLDMESNNAMESLISLIHSLGLKVAADGIETGRQAERLKAADCDIAQGNNFCMPLPPEQIAEVHRNRF